jgi:hypothetical protein
MAIEEIGTDIPLPRTEPVASIKPEPEPEPESEPAPNDPSSGTALDMYA